MPTRPTSYLALRAFEAASRHASFTEAARELHVSQAAISRHIRLLEADLGRPLFVRLHRRVELTPVGKQLAESLTASFAQIARAIEAARLAPPRRLRISVEPAFAARWLVPRFGRFAAAYPDIEIELDASNDIRTIDRDTDIAIRFLSSRKRKPKGRARKLFSYSGFPVIASRLRADRGERGRDSDVLAYRLLHDDDGTEWRRWFSAAKLRGFETAKHLYLNETSLVLTAALRGQGAAVSAPLYLHSQLKSGKLKRIGDTRVALGDYWLLESTDRATAKTRLAFITWFNAEAKRLLNPPPGTPSAEF
jgi:LysR family glycine cleavage system transcriptional activator